MKINISTYPTKNQIQLIKANPHIQRAMVEAKSWQVLRNLILSKVITTDDVLLFFENKYKNN